MANDNKLERELQKRLEIAEKYTNGDQDTIKKIVSGNYHDVQVIKSRFKNETDSTFGLFIIYLSLELKQTIGIETCVSSSPSIYKHKPFDGFKLYEESISTELKSEDNNDNSDMLKSAFLEALDQNKVGILSDLIDNRDYTELTKFFKELIEEVIDSKLEDCQIETEKINCIQFDEISKVKLRIAKESAEEDSPEFTKSDDPYAGNVLLKGKPVLSPVRGKYINQLDKGDTIKVLIDEDTKKAINIAQKLDAYEDNEMKPIVGEVDSYSKVIDLHQLHVLIAPYILVVIQEEENVKVATVSSAFAEQEEKKSRSGTIIGLAIFLVLLLLIIIVLMDN